LVHFGLVRADSLIVDALSGVSGAGRTPGQGYHFPECNENARAYGLLRHRHIPEIEQELAAISKAGGYDGTVSLSFTPHLVPLNRGILVTGWADLASGVNVDIESLRETYEGFYEGKTFIRILPPDQIPQTKAVLGSNYCDISVRVDGRTKRVLVMSAIDNLVKGAAGQAIQNMNLMFGEPEDRGLKSAPIWP
ncbi:MAG TPA: N-acetyl-gamma-glutamyl-phosphate reductase, partial [Firmicutes bacterium]|nr:N-acetyl-gamma-glutamyl-phosphate reductase [Bacillota bacterium]